jgi:hypothetical protein
MTYLLTLLFFTQTIDVDPGILAAGKDGYLKKANAIRQKVINEADKHVRACQSLLTAARAGRVDTTLTGTVRSSGAVIGGRLTFGSEVEKENQIRSLSRQVAEWRAYLSGLRTKDIVPQIAPSMASTGITIGAVGVLRFAERDEFEVNEVIDAKTCRIAVRNMFLKMDGRPTLLLADMRQSFFIVEHHGSAGVRVGDKTDFPGMYQFSGVRDGDPVFTLLEDMKTGPVRCVVDNGGSLVDSLPQ